MKILIVNGNFGVHFNGPSGASCHLRAMAHAFHRLGHDVIVATTWSESKSGPIPLLCFPPRNLFYPLRRWPELREIRHNAPMTGHLLEHFRGQEPSLIYERHSLFCDVGTRLAKRWNIPHILEVNAPQVAERSQFHGLRLQSLGQKWEQRIFSGAKRILAVSAPLGAHVLSRGASPNALRVIANGVDCEVFRPQPVHEPLLRELGWSKNTPVVAFVGTFKPWHRLDMLLETFLQVSKEVKGARFLMIGEGPLRGHCEKWLSKAGLSQSVHFSGHCAQQQVAQYLSLADLALSPGHGDYFCPLKVLEYMACGAVVLAADTAVLRELLKEGQAGLLIEGGAQVWAQEIVDLLFDEPRKQSFREAALPLARAHRWDDVAGTVLAWAAEDP